MIPHNLLYVFKNYNDYPVLENITPQMDYIDNIHQEQMKSSLMKGTDVYNRQFIAIKLFPRDLYEKMLKQRHENHESCLTLIALSRFKYFPPDIARHIYTFIEYRPFSRYYSYDTEDEIMDGNQKPVKPLAPPPKILSLKKFLQNQISVHTIFQRYTVTGLDKSPFVHAENSGRCLPRYRWKLLDINTLILLSNGNWNYGDGVYDPRSELTSLLEDSHPKCMIYNEKVEKLINASSS